MQTLIRGGRVFDGQRFTEGDVLPGLTDVHLHMKGISSPGWSVDVGEGCFPFGVTAAADASASRGDKALLDTFPVETGVFVIVSTKEPLCFDETMQRLERYGDRVLGIKVLYDQKANPALTDEKPLQRICDFAHGRGLPVLVHTANSPVSMERLLSVLQPGDIATHVFHGGQNNASEDDFACLKEAKKRGIFLDSCICAGEHVDFEIYRKALSAGIYPDLMGTDLAEEIAARGGRYGLTMGMTVARVLGMPEEELFRAVTGNAGKALRRPWGRLEEGLPADLALLQWSDAPMELADRYGHRLTSDRGYICRMTIRAGKTVFEQ